MAKLTLTADGRKMRLAREAADLTVDDLVERLRAAGIERHVDTIRNIELGHQQPGLELFNAYARIVGVPRMDLAVDEPTAESA
ncbi:helix-turn-helix domain-containing protein [Actinomadura sediminis]|uniref:Helix-turn-helix transcriptional regulator n=1 Tax=Actinomadura sediminis TaxID=1038904 RepID=A0ABW3ERJ4_9ACTN